MQNAAQPISRNTIQGGFTLIEPMIVVAIIGQASGGFTVAFDNGVHSGSSMVIQPLISNETMNDAVATASTSGGQITGWRCSSTTIDDTFLPSACRP